MIGHPGDLVLEFKPKWLAQSPNAPPSATRCRNCAREVLRYHTKRHTNFSQQQQTAQNQNPPTILCPLNFLTCATSPAAVTNILTNLNPPISRETTPAAQYTRLTHWLRTNTLLPRLRRAQVANDNRNNNSPLRTAANDDGDDDDTHDPRFPLAMTLRDCTCFVRIPADPSRPVEAKLADLDKKNRAAKLGYWQEMERRLVDGGYYEGREEGGRIETNCQLGVVEGLGF